MRILEVIALLVVGGLMGFILGAQFQIAFVFSALVVILAVRSWRLGRQRRYLA